MSWSSQSLSGWDGDFHMPKFDLVAYPSLNPYLSQSLSGWDGDFHLKPKRGCTWRARSCRNPFQGGMGIST